MFNKGAMVKAALAAQKKKPVEGSAVEEKGESKSVEKKEVKAGKGDKPSSGMSAKAKSSAVKQAQSGADMGKKNVPGKSGFSTVVNNAKSEGNSAENAQKIAGAVFWKKMKRSA